MVCGFQVFRRKFHGVEGGQPGVPHNKEKGSQISLSPHALRIAATCSFVNGITGGSSLSTEGEVAAGSRWSISCPQPT